MIFTDDHWATILGEIRKESGFSTSDLSRLSGNKASTIENYEHKKIIHPSIYRMEILLKAMDYDLDAIKR